MAGMSTGEPIRGNPYREADDLLVKVESYARSGNTVEAKKAAKAALAILDSTTPGEFVGIEKLKRDIRQLIEDIPVEGKLSAKLRENFPRVPPDILGKGKTSQRSGPFR